MLHSPCSVLPRGLAHTGQGLPRPHPPTSTSWYTARSQLGASSPHGYSRASPPDRAAYSLEYERVGGKRLSERKRPQRNEVSPAA